MWSIYRDPWFTFRFSEDRLIPRFHLEGVAPGTAVAVYAVDPITQERQGLLRKAVTGPEGWVELLEPLLVRAGEVFIAVPG